MLFKDSLRQRLEEHLEDSLENVRRNLKNKPYIENISTYLKLKDFKNNHPFLSNEIIEDTIGLKKHSISSALNNYYRNHKGKWKI